MKTMEPPLVEAVKDLLMAAKSEGAVLLLNVLSSPSMSLRKGRLPEPSRKALREICLTTIEQYDKFVADKPEPLGKANQVLVKGWLDGASKDLLSKASAIGLCAELVVAMLRLLYSEKPLSCSETS